MLSFFERSHTMINKAGGTTPHHSIAAFEEQAAHRIRTAFSTPKEDGRHTKRNGDDRGPGIVLVAIPMQTQFSALHIAIDQAGVGIIISESALGSGADSDVQESVR